MYPDKVISTFITELNNRIPPPVHTGSMDDNRPIPAVIIEGIEIQDENHHNSDFAGEEYDSNGNVISEIKRHYYNLRLELNVRDDDEIQAFKYLGDLKSALSDIGDDPTHILHNDIRKVQMKGSGEVSYQFYEPTETELNQSVVLKTFLETTNSDVDVIETVNDNLSYS